MTVLILAMLAAWAVGFLVAYLGDDQAHGRRIGGTR